MKHWMTFIQIWILFGLMVFTYPLILKAEDGHDHENKEHADEGHSENEHGKEEEGGVHLTQAQRQAANITTTALKARTLRGETLAPGEIMLNEYATSKVTPRINAQVVQRHAKLGEVVTAGQELVTLSSVDMAQAQGDLLVAEREWQRVRKLGRKVVSEARYTQARVGREQARARVLAFGMSEAQLDDLIKTGKAEKANGQFQLVAAQDGTVIRDHFILGELVEPGHVLFEISDESVLWVEAKLTPDQAAQIRQNASASIQFRKQSFNGRVIQIHHALDEDTRTLGVRIEVANPDDALHPGLFVDTRIETGGTEHALAVPADAVLRSPDGDWMVFVEHEDNEFEPQEVEVLRTSNGLSVIEGLEEGSRVVTTGAFFLQSELAKSGFDIHNH